MSNVCLFYLVQTTPDSAPLSETGGKIAQHIIASADSDPITRAVAVRVLLEGDNNDNVLCQTTIREESLNVFLGDNRRPCF